MPPRPSLGGPVRFESTPSITMSSEWLMALEAFSLPFNLLHETIEGDGEFYFERSLSG